MVIDHINDQICVIIRNVLINKQIVPELWRDTSSSLQVYAGKLLVLREELTEETELQQEEGHYRKWSFSKRRGTFAEIKASETGFDN